jgi:formate dehydrogenase major subunit
MELADGPLPEHYEPLESPLSSNPFNRQMLNPVVKPRRGGPQVRAAGDGPGFPYVCSTYRVSEHWQTGVMTRHMPWLLELQPQLFVELSHELAREKGIEPGARVRVSSPRGAVTAVALPTARMKPMLVKGRRVHQVGLPWCFGWIMPRGGECGDSANLLTPDVGDANTMIPETKAFMVNIERAEV